METRFLVIGDLHGDIPKVHYKSFDALIVPGDVCSDAYTRKFKAAWEKLNAKSKEMVAWEDFMAEKVGSEKLRKADEQSLRQGRRVLAHLNKYKKPVFFIPGNWDKSYAGSIPKKMPEDYALYTKKFLEFWMAKRSNPKLINGLKYVVDCQMRTVPYCGYNIIGYGLVSGPEMVARRRKKLKLSKKKDIAAAYKAYDKLEGMVDSLFKKRDKSKPTLFLSHNVPYNTKLDILLNKKSPLHKTHMGSSIARKMILRYKPEVCIGGHMHEHFNKQMLGKTLVINAGFGPKVNTLLTMSSGKVKDVKFFPKKYGGRKR